jgi:hypothetical protein
LSILCGQAWIIILVHPTELDKTGVTVEQLVPSELCWFYPTQGWTNSTDSRLAVT